MLFILNTDFKTIQIKGCYLQPLNVGFNGLKIYRAKILILAEDGRYLSDQIFYTADFQSCLAKILTVTVFSRFQCLQLR